VSGNARGTIQPSRVLTSSLSWDLDEPELPCSLDDAKWVRGQLG